MLHATATLATVGLVLASQVSAHIALWHPSMYGWDPSNPNQQEPVDPLYQLPYSQWWLHGYINQPPADGEVMELPAGGVFHGEVGCNKVWTSWGADPSRQQGADGKYACDTTGPLHTSDPYGTPDPKDVKGCALAIAYESDVTKVTPEMMTIFSVNYTCPWFRDVDFEVPADLPACPEGGCICTWNWIHASDAGSEQIYNLGYRCNVVGASNTQTLSTTPKVANKCGYPTDTSNCTVGPKTPFVWMQAERNNIFQGYYDEPTYSPKYGFRNGAQLDLFSGDSTSNPTSTTSDIAKAASTTVAASQATQIENPVQTVSTASFSSQSPAATSQSTEGASATTTSSAASSTSTKTCKRGMKKRKNSDRRRVRRVARDHT